MPDMSWKHLMEDEEIVEGLHQVWAFLREENNYTADDALEAVHLMLEIGGGNDGVLLSLLNTAIMVHSIDEEEAPEAIYSLFYNAMWSNDEDDE